jgi:hypothetical protein
LAAFNSRSRTRTRGNFAHWCDRPVHDNGVTSCSIYGREAASLIFNRSIRSERTILQDHRQVIDSKRPRQAQPSIGSVIDDDQSGETHIDLSTSVVMWMGMEPKRRSRLIDLQDGAPTVARTDQSLWPAIIVTGYQEPVPMHRRNSLDVIFDRHLDFIATAHANDRPQDWC